MDDKTREALAHSLTASSTELLPHLPYLLQDLWYLGGDADAAVKLLRPVVEAWQRDSAFRVLDLACGKGAGNHPGQGTGRLGQGHRPNGRFCHRSPAQGGRARRGPPVPL